MSGVVRWETPPGGKDNHAAAMVARWKPVADELRAHPGEWAVIEEGDCQTHNTLIGYIRSGRGPFAPAKSFEVKQRTEKAEGQRGGRIGQVYARYIGGVE